MGSTNDEPRLDIETLKRAYAMVIKSEGAVLSGRLGFPEDELLQEVVQYDATQTLAWFKEEFPWVKDSDLVATFGVQFVTGFTVALVAERLTRGEEVNLP